MTFVNLCLLSKTVFERNVKLFSCIQVFVMFQPALAFFQTCGYYPVAIIPKKSSKTWTKVLGFWSFSMSLLVLSFLMFMVINQDTMLYSETPIGKINDILVYFSLLIAHLAIIVESFLKRKYFQKYWMHYENITRLRNPSARRYWKTGVGIKMIAFVLFSLTAEVLIITNITSDHQWTNFWFAEVFSLLMTRNRHLQHIFFIDIIFFTLEDMNSRLRNLIAWTKVIRGDKMFARKLLHGALLLNKEQFKHLMEMLICVNRIFCWSQVLNFGQHFVEVTSELYWVYAFATGPTFMWRKIHIQEPGREISRFSIFPATLVPFIPTIVVLMMLLTSATRCIKEVILIVLLFSAVLSFSDYRFKRKQHCLCMTYMCS